MKITKYILLSTTVLGLSNPLIVLADENGTSSSPSTNNISEAGKNTHLKESQKGLWDKNQYRESELTNENIKKKSQLTELSTIPVELSSDGTMIVKSGDYTNVNSLIYGLGSTPDEIEQKKVLVKKVIFDGSVIVRGNAMGLFQDLVNMKSIEGIQNLNTSDATNLSQMFDNCSSLENVELGGIDTSNTQSLSYMFKNTKALKKVDISKWNTSNSHDFDGMFYRTGMNKIDISSIKFSTAATAKMMIQGNSELTEVNIGDVDTSKVNNMYAMFAYNNKLEKLDLHSFDLSGLSGTGKIQDINAMFEGDTVLKSLTLGSKFTRMTGSNLPEHLEDDRYTNKWQSVGNGTEDEPSGDKIWTSAEFMNNYNGSMSETYVWQPRPATAANVTVKYVDENGKDIINPEIKSGYVGDDYTTEQKAFDGYTFHDVKGETSGKLDSQSKTVTYTYYKDDGSNHTVNFYDMNGKKIADEIKIDGRFEDNYDLTEQVNTTLKDLQKQGYKQVSNYGSIKGKFVQVHDGAGYILTKLPEDAVGTVKVNYVDEQGQSISDSKILGGKLGSDYQTEKKNIDGYTFKEVQGKETGKITNKEQTVTYVYTKNPEKGADVTVKYVDENGKEIAKSEVKSGNVGDKYTTEKKDIAGYTFKEVKGSTNGEFTDKAQTVTYIYTKNPEKGADVTVKYVDENGKEIAKSEVKSGNVGDKYTTEKKDVEGYTFKEVKGSVSGEFTDKAQTVTYIYTKNDDNVKPSEPSQPAKPDKPDHSGDTDKPTDNNSNSSEQPGNNSTVNDIVNNVVRSVLPKTAAAKVTLAGIVSVVLASLVGLVVWKRRK